MKIIPCSLSMSLLALFFVIFSASAIFLWHADFGWHDQQRIGQLLLIICAAPMFLFLPKAVLPRTALALLVGVFGIGLASSWLSASPQWALLEWARYAGLVLLALLLGGIARSPRVGTFVLFVMAFVGIFQIFQFLFFYLVAFIYDIRVLNVNGLVGGFDNPRFYGQFQVMLLPVLGLLALLNLQRGNAKDAGILLFVLAIQWCMSYVVGGRGLWLGLLVGHVAVLLINPGFWRLLVLQFCTALLGAIAFLLLFKWIPYWQGIDSFQFDSLHLGLSFREEIWSSAWDMALANPWFGVGPMHFAAAYNPIAAHPHQVILQWLAEWGFGATAMALMIGLLGVRHVADHLRSPIAGEYDAGLAVAILGALVLAQVDGVFVMPYSETWLAVLIGLALARWSAPEQEEAFQRPVMAFFALAVLIVFLPVIAKHVPLSPFYEKVYLQKSKAIVHPRFWVDGWIPVTAL